MKCLGKLTSATLMALAISAHAGGTAIQRIVEQIA